MSTDVSQGFWKAPIAVKVPEVTTGFWVLKLLTTGMGETTSDFLVHRFDPPLAAAVVGTVFLAALCLHVRSSRLHFLLYWLVVVLVAIFGTMVADAIHVTAGVPYLLSAPALALVVLAIFALWRRLEGTLDMATIDTRRRELLYWALVVATFAMGTALGDLTATSFGLGYLASALLFTAAIVPPALLFWRGKGVIAFWCAYVLTRPVGASFADWMGVGPERGGLGWGTGPVSLAIGLLIIVVAGAMFPARRRPAIAKAAG
ncbi:MAG: hypothetical protein ACOH2M_22230 [Cypionkella sp.]